jgi:hypothetical protein
MRHLGVFGWHYKASPHKLPLSQRVTFAYTETILTVRGHARRVFFSALNPYANDSSVPSGQVFPRLARLL